MEKRRIGSLEVSAIGLGCNNFGMRCDAAQTKAVVDAALDAGITFFDTADVYGGTRSEELLGQALGSRRDEVVIATKFGIQLGSDPEKGGASPRWVRQAVEDSLRRLGTDRIDLYQQHRPDPDVPLAETMGALDELVRAGKVREVGHSNFTASMARDAASLAKVDGVTPYASAQNHLSLLHRDPVADLLPTCADLGVAVLPYFPLANGMLTGKYRRGEAAPEGTRLSGLPAERAERVLSPETFDVIEALDAFARDHGRTLLDLAFAWLLALPAMGSVIAGATRPEQALANAAAGDWVLGVEDLAAVDAILERPVGPDAP